MTETTSTLNALGEAPSSWEKADEQDVVIRRIKKDQRFQMRHKLDPSTIKRYVGIYQAEKSMPPVKIGLIDGVPFLLDGWHRFAALEELGQETASALVIECGEQQALWLAASANLEHGLPLKVAELRAVFRAMVRAKRHRDTRGRLLPYRDIGQIIGKPHTTIRNWMMKDFPKIAAQYSGDDGFVGKGGYQEFIIPSPSLRDVTEAIASAVEAYKSIKSPELRFSAIEAMTKALKDMKEEGDWLASPF